MAKKRKSRFGDKVRKDNENQKSKKNSFGYLQVPKGIEIYNPKPGSKDKLDFMLYNVKANNHPDADKEAEIAVKGTEWYKRPFKVHRNIGPNDEAVVCLTSFGKKCPICEHKKKLAASGATKDELKPFNTSNRTLFIVIPIDVKDFDESIHIMDVSDYCFYDLLQEELDEESISPDFPTIEDGSTLRVRWNEETFNKNKFAMAGRIDEVKRDADYDESILDDCPDLDKCLVEMSYESLNSLFLQIEDDDNDPDDDDDGLPFKDLDEDEDEGNDLSWDDLADMDDEEMTEVVDDYDLDLDMDDYEDDEKGLRKAIADELGIKKPKKRKK